MTADSILHSFKKESSWAAAATACGSRPGRPQTGLVGGDPDGEVTLAWTVAQDLMDLYCLDDPRPGPHP